MDALGINWPGLLTQVISFVILFTLLKKFFSIQFNAAIPSVLAPHNSPELFLYNELTAPNLAVTLS